MKKLSVAVLLGCMMCMSLTARDEPAEKPSVLRTRDIKSQSIRKWLTAAGTDDLKAVSEMLAEDLVVMINAQEVKPRSEFLARLTEVRTKLFRNMRFTGPFDSPEYSVHTNYFSPSALATNGKTYAENGTPAPIWTNAWLTFEGTGRLTGQTAKLPVHMDFLWSDGQVSMILIYHDEKPFVEERAALEKSKK